MDAIKTLALTKRYSDVTAVDALNADLATSIEEGNIANVTYDEFDHEAAAAAMAPLYEKYNDKYGAYFDRVRALAN